MTQPNMDTVRSFADLLVEDETDDIPDISPTPATNSQRESTPSTPDITVNGGKEASRSKTPNNSAKTPNNSTNTTNNSTNTQTNSTNSSNNRTSTPTSSTNSGSLRVRIPVVGEGVLEDGNDSVFGDIPLEEPSGIQFDVHTSTPNPDDTCPFPETPPTDFLDKQPDLQRHASLRSQLSSSSSHKEPVKREVKLKLFVATLFIMIVTVVAVTLHFANVQEYMVELGKKIIVHEDTRYIHLKGGHSDDALIGRFGMGITDGVLPHDCSVDKFRKSHLCLKWKEQAILNINYWEDRSSKCYTIHWKTLHPDTVLKDCYRLNNGKVFWFGGSLKENQQWPLMNASIPLMPYITGQLGDEESFGPVIERYWLSSKGVAIFSPDLTSPVSISWNAPDPHDANATEGDDQLCLVVGQPQNKYYQKSSDKVAFLNYSLCLSEDILDVHRVALEKISSGRNISEIFHPDVSIFQKPSLSVYRALEGDVKETSLVKLGKRMKEKNIDFGMFLIEDGWQKHNGDYEFDGDKFLNVSDTMLTLSDMGYRVILGLNPYISIHSKNFIPSVNQDLLVKDGGGQTTGIFNIYPDKNNYNITNLHAPLDITSSLPKQWFLERLRELKDETNTEHFNFQGGLTRWLPFTTSLSQSASDPNIYTFHYSSLSLDDSIMSIVDSATSMQGQPVIIRLPISDLENALPLALTLGVMGYPYVMPVMNLTPLGSLPSKSLYIRSVQLSAFLPIMHLSHPPDVYDQETEDIVRDVIRTHQEIVHVRVSNHSDSLLLDPVIKPLWWLAPSDQTALKIDDQFIVGDDLLVAPVLKEGGLSRDIYIPTGTWRNPRDGVKHNGPEMLHDYNVPLNVVPYFIKM